MILLNFVNRKISNGNVDWGHENMSVGTKIQLQECCDKIISLGEPFTFIYEIRNFMNSNEISNVDSDWGYENMLLLAVVVRNNMAQVFLILTQIFIQLTWISFFEYDLTCLRLWHEAKDWAFTKG